ncbi:microtubule-associated tumor suppressor candidate 2-like [Limulus polyphemus]|uniref:Microtubule-associated tumor suppressor candidate 2-like n=1 Tax=Limulus polyphemus TaxID=6850 RepID=A0ABM1RZJ1_LIMPO|nr:microtubule-associated tumor suppressor candidate 2-like [Limulus polyphemus]
MKQKTELKKEVESLKTVLEMKKSEIQNLRTENLKMQKDLEELPLAKEQVEKLKARNEDLQARVDEKVELERLVYKNNNRYTSLPYCIVVKQLQ